MAYSRGMQEVVV